MVGNLGSPHGILLYNQEINIDYVTNIIQIYQFYDDFPLILLL